MQSLRNDNAYALSQEQRGAQTRLHSCGAVHCMACACTCIYAQVYYDFGLADVIRKLFANPEWAAARGKGRDTSAAGFHGSFKTHSTGIVRLRRAIGCSPECTLCAGSPVDTLGMQDAHSSADKAARQR